MLKRQGLGARERGRGGGTKGRREGRTMNVKIPETVNTCLSPSHQLLKSLEVGKAKWGGDGQASFVSELLNYSCCIKILKIFPNLVSSIQ